MTMKRKFQYAEQRPGYNGKSVDIIITVTEDWIRCMYWPFWLKRMLAHGGLTPKITWNNCLADWMATHWAVEIT